jgi:hypothetical protein
MSAAEIIDLTHEQQKTLARLLDAERRHVLNWWTCLNELRIHKQLPEWARSGPFGRHADYNAWAEDRKALNRALFGQEQPTSTEPVEA